MRHVYTYLVVVLLAFTYLSQAQEVSRSSYTVAYDGYFFDTPLHLPSFGTQTFVGEPFAGFRFNVSAKYFLLSASADALLVLTTEYFSEGPYARLYGGGGIGCLALSAIACHMHAVLGLEAGQDKLGLFVEVLPMVFIPPAASEVLLLRVGLNFYL